MADITYFVISSDDCKYESMTKEQIVAAIAEATGNTPTGIDDAFISKIKEINASGTVQIWKGTEAQFNAISPVPTVNKSAIRVGTNGILYICTDDTGDDSVLSGVKYTISLEPDTADKKTSSIKIIDNTSSIVRAAIAVNEDSNNSENETSQLVLRNSSVNGRISIQSNDIGKKGLRIIDENGVTRVDISHNTNGDTCEFHINDASGSDVTLETIGAQERFLCGRNQTIATSAWTSNTTYADYPYRASVALPPITAVSFAEIVFSPADAISGNFAPVCDTYNGGVYLYAKAVPSAAVTIPTIVVWR